MTDDGDEEDQGGCGQHIAVAQGLARHVEALAAEVTDNEVSAFVQGCNLSADVLNRDRVRLLLNELIARRQRRGQFAAFAIDE